VNFDDLGVGCSTCATFQQFSSNSPICALFPGELALAMVAAGHAEIGHRNGNVRSVQLITTASMHARMIGPPTGDCGSPPFVVREKRKALRGVVASRAGDGERRPLSEDGQ
jgi:hypothetical protein